MSQVANRNGDLKDIETREGIGTDGVRIWTGESLQQAPISERRCGFVPTGAKNLVGNTVKTQKAGRASWDKVPSFERPTARAEGN